jgi:hypothetical protein
MFSKLAGTVSGAGSEGATRNEGASLSSVLETPALRVELALLVLLCIDSMRSDLVATFDSNQSSETKPSPVARPPPPAKEPSNDLIDLEEPKRGDRVSNNNERKYQQMEHDSMQMRHFGEVP